MECFYLPSVTYVVKIRGEVERDAWIQFALRGETTTSICTVTSTSQEKNSNLSSLGICLEHNLECDCIFV